MEKQQAAQEVADSLFEAERALDDALAKISAAVTTATAARARLGVSLKTGAGAITKMASVSATLAEARETIADAHSEFGRIQPLLGVRTEMTGGGEKGPNQDGVPFLSAVKAA